jgi:hypothetical protein
LNDFLFLDEISEIMNFVVFEIREISAEYSSTNEDRFSSYFFLCSSNHSAKSVTFLIIDQTAELND